MSDRLRGGYFRTKTARGSRLASQPLRLLLVSLSDASCFRRPTEPWGTALSQNRPETNGLQGLTCDVLPIHNGMLADTDYSRCTNTTQRRDEKTNMALSERQLLDALSRTPFVESTELALILGEPHATVHRHLTGLLADGIVGHVIHGTAPSAVEREILPDDEGHP